MIPTRVLLSIVTVSTCIFRVANAEVGLVSYAECQVNGYTIGTSKAAMIEQLGEPLPPPPRDPNELLFDVMHHAFDYDGLIVIFGQSLDVSGAIRILGNGYRLKSGIEVGSTKQDVLEYYGPTDEVAFESLVILPYQVTWDKGQPTAHHLDFTIVDGVVTRVDVHPRQTTINRLPY